MHPASNLSISAQSLPIELEEYNTIYHEFFNRLEVTIQNHERALDAYIYGSASDAMDRRRKMLGCYINLILTWREMSNFAEVALGSGDMLNFAPMHQHTIVRNWAEPVMVFFVDCQNEISTMVKFCALTIDRARLILQMKIDNGLYDDH